MKKIEMAERQKEREMELERTRIEVQRGKFQRREEAEENPPKARFARV